MDKNLVLQYTQLKIPLLYGARKTIVILLYQLNVNKSLPDLNMIKYNEFGIWILGTVHLPIPIGRETYLVKNARIAIIKNAAGIGYQR